MCDGRAEAVQGHIAYLGHGCIPWGSGWGERKETCLTSVSLLGSVSYHDRTMLSSSEACRSHGWDVFVLREGRRHLQVIDHQSNHSEVSLSLGCTLQLSVSTRRVHMLASLGAPTSCTHKHGVE